MRHEHAVAVATLHSSHVRELHVSAALPGRRNHRHHIAWRQLAGQHVGPGLGAGQRRRRCLRRALATPSKQVMAWGDCGSTREGD